MSFAILVGLPYPLLPCAEAWHRYPKELFRQDEQHLSPSPRPQVQPQVVDAGLCLVDRVGELVGLGLVGFAVCSKYRHDNPMSNSQLGSGRIN